MTTTDNQPDKCLKESLSALMDNEAHEIETHRVLNALRQDPALKDIAFSYQLIGETLRKETNAFAGVDLSSTIGDAIADEPVLGAETDEKPTASGWQSLNRFVVAASVTLAVIVGAQFWSGQDSSNDGLDGFAEVQREPAKSAADNGMLAADYGALSVLAGYGSEQKGLSPSQLSRARVFADNVARERFSAYMLQHAEQQSSYAGQGVLPFVRATSFDRP